MPKFIILEKITKTVSGFRYISVEAESIEEAFKRWNGSNDDEPDMTLEIPEGFEVVLDETELDEFDSEFEYIKLDGQPETTLSYDAIHNRAYPDAPNDAERAS